MGKPTRLFPLGLPSVPQEGFWESLGLRTLEAWDPSLLGMWRAIAGELKYLVTSGCPFQEGATKRPGVSGLSQHLEPRVKMLHGPLAKG